jgi:hypothetical protein
VRVNFSEFKCNFFSRVAIGLPMLWPPWVLSALNWKS